MGKYDNYSNAKNIQKAQKKLDKLMGKRKPNQFEIDLAQQELDTAKLFESCQIFGRADAWRNMDNPNDDVMFSDDNELMWFIDIVIPYKDIESYRLIEHRVQRSRTTTETNGGISRAIVGGAIAGGAGAIIGASTAGSTSHTTFYETKDGYYFQIFLKDGKGYQYPVRKSTFGKPSKLWLELCSKVQTIIDANK